MSQRTGERTTIDLEAALEEQLFDVTVAQGRAQIPGDGLQDQRRFVVAAFEIVLRPALQLLDEGVQDHGPPPGLEAHMQPASSTQSERQNFATGSASSPKSLASSP